MATLEAVLVFPVLLLLIMFSIQVALWYHAAALADAAAQDGVRAARVQGATAATGAARANQLLDQAGRTILEGRQVTASRTSDIARVEVRGRCIAADAVRVVARTCGRREHDGAVPGEVGRGER